METKRTTRKSGSKASDDRNLRIHKAYMEYLLTHGVRPVSVYKFCLDAGFTEQEFYDLFGSFESLERSIWKGFIDKTTGRLQADGSFSGFTAREKILAFYFTLLEELRAHRSFILLESHTLRRLEITPAFLKDFKTAFEAFIESILTEGKSKGEVATRPYLDKRYPQLFWMHLGFVLQFWKDDGSAGFEKTDVVIEKSVNLAFDLIGKGAIDTAFDFAKFMYQTKFN